MSKHPIIQLYRTKFQRLLDFLVLTTLCFYWVSVIHIYPTLPNLIPIHFGLDGKPDAVGASATIFLLPIVATALVILMTILSFMPHLFNYPVPIDRTNAHKQYRMAVTYLLLTQLILLFTFIAIDYHVVLIVFDKESQINPFCIALWIFAIFTPSIFHYIRSKKAKAE